MEFYPANATGYRMHKPHRRTPYTLIRLDLFLGIQAPETGGQFHLMRRYVHGPTATQVEPVVGLVANVRAVLPQEIKWQPIRVE